MMKTGDARMTCPACGDEVLMPTTATLDQDACTAVVVVSQGTMWVHVRDEHPEEWERMCSQRREMNANPNIAFMPRKVDGTFLLDGEDVADVSG
jgi:hypothetical protein